MRDSRMQSQIVVLKCRKFWRENRGAQNLRENSFKGREKFEIQWGYLYFTDCEICELKIVVQENVNIEIFVNYL